MSDLVPLEDEAAILRRRADDARSVARAICRAYGPRPTCLCQGDPSRCHAATLYALEASAAVLDLYKNGRLR